MEHEYDGKIDNIDMPDPILLEVQTSVLVESNYRGEVQYSAEYDSGNKLRLDIDLYEQYLGDEEYSNLPVVKYSTERFTPALCNQLRLRTPNYYRGLETGAAGLYDQFEGCRFPHRFGTGSKMVMTPEDGSGKRFVFDASGATKIDLCTKTFMYCTSLDSESNLLDLEKATVLYGSDYTHGSVFKNAKQLAQGILEAFAKAVGRPMLEVAEPDGEESFARTYAWIVHGPVRYLPDVDMGMKGIESYFTKPDMYRNQNEYRFWVGLNDNPSQKDEAELLISILNGMASGIALK